MAARRQWQGNWHLAAAMASPHPFPPLPEPSHLVLSAGVGSVSSGGSQRGDVQVHHQISIGCLALLHEKEKGKTEQEEWREGGRSC